MASPVEQIKEVWARLQPMQRALVISAAVATLGVIAALVYFSSQPEYKVLFSDLKASDAQTIVDKLKAENVPYELKNNGTMISVPAERVTELRLQLAANGALSGGHVGFDIFDKSNFGATDFAQRVNYQRALEGELARTLEGMDEVETARVHITPARESIFTQKGERAKASVVLRVRQNRELSRERTEGVLNLLASAVEGLDPGDVSVLDTRGRVLSSPTQDKGGLNSGANSFSSHLEARQQLEASTAARVVALLEPITGAGHVRAEVTADLDFSQIEQTAEKYDPKSSVIRTQQTLSETRNSKLPPNGGVVGARANDPEAQPGALATPTPAPLLGDQRSSATTNYEIDKTVTRTLDGGGRLQRLSVSVVVDNQLVNGKPVPRSEEEIKKLQELVAAAVGISTERGDQIVVQTIPFEQPAADAEKLPFVERYRDLIQLGIKYFSLVLAVVLLLLFIVRPARRALLAASQPPPQQLLLPAAAEGSAGLTVAEAISSSENGLAALPAADQTGDRALEAGEAMTITTPLTVAELEDEIARQLESPVPEVKRALALKKQLVEQGLQDPETLAMTIRSWLQEKPEAQ
jgi:flagellar M-ring protein FliF